MAEEPGNRAGAYNYTVDAPASEAPRTSSQTETIATPKPSKKTGTSKGKSKSSSSKKSTGSKSKTGSRRKSSSKSKGAKAKGPVNTKTDKAVPTTDVAVVQRPETVPKLTGEKRVDQLVHELNKHLNTNIEPLEGTQR